MSYQAYKEKFDAPVRFLGAKVYLGVDSSAPSYSNETNLVSLEIQRAGEENKFFGFCICQRLNFHLLDINRQITISAGSPVCVQVWDKTANNTADTFSPYPVVFYVTEVNRDENTNELSVTAYDTVYFMSDFTIGEVNILPPYRIIDVEIAILNFMRNKGYADYILTDTTYTDELLDETEALANDKLEYLRYPEGANLDGTETIRDVMNAICEARGTVYYLGTADEVGSQFNYSYQRKMNAETCETSYLTKDDYVDLDVSTNRRLTAICTATDLGDNIIAETGLSGTTQYIRNNPFLTLRDDVGDILQVLINRLGNMTIAQYNCEWRGCPELYYVNPASQLNFTTKDDDIAVSYLFNDTISYNGSLVAKCEWQYNPNNDSETFDNPATLGDALKYTYARVDKANREIQMVASQADENSKEIAQIKLNTDSITQSVEKVYTTLDESMEAVYGDIDTLTKRVEATMTEEEYVIKVQEILSDGVDSVTTTTGYTFDDEGLTISKSDSEMKTQITDDGMVVYKDDDEMLVANNTGVYAQNLHATTYLIIGENSRFEDYLDEDNNRRTGCFWIWNGDD